MFFMAHCDATVDSSNDTVRVFLNTVDHKTVMCKLYKCGVRGVILNLLSDYLTNGKQDVTVADTI